MPDDRDRVWAGTMPQAYDRSLAPAVFRPFAVDLARRAARFAPRRLLEIAAGTGVLTRELVTAVPAVLGDRELRLAPVPPRPGAPLIRIRAHALAGDVYVRTPADGEKPPSWWSWLRPSRW